RSAVLLWSATLPPANYSRSLHDALPIYGRIVRSPEGVLTRIVEERDASADEKKIREVNTGIYCFSLPELRKALTEIKPHNAQGRSEEHTSELQSRENLVCRLLLEKKNKK